MRLFKLTLGCGLVVLSACSTHLLVKDFTTRWNDREKYAGVNVVNLGDSGAKPFDVRFIGKNKQGATVFSVDQWCYCSLNPGGDSKSVGVDLTPYANESNNCLQDVATITAIADPQNVNHEKFREKYPDNQQTAVVPWQAHADWPWSVAGHVGFKADRSPSSRNTPSSLVSVRFTIDPDPRAQGQGRLQQIRYSLHHGAEERPFFTDSIALYGQAPPVVVDVVPGIEYPEDPLPVRIEAKLMHAGGEDNFSGILPAPWDSEQSARMYLSYRRGYLRRHLVQSGRELGGVWLKEYQPGSDRAELLWHSRTATFAGQTRVYVPWQHTCGRSGVCPDTEATPGPTEEPTYCGRTIKEGSVVQYGGDENPLLDGGLAMSVFANEYLATRNESSLEHALRLFEFVVRSEWKDPTQGYAPTGFFLRSPAPGNRDRDSKEEYVFASTDELVGMSLGLGNLWLALRSANPRYKAEMSRLIALVDRLATQLRDNFFLILPLRKQDGHWRRMGLPLAVHRGAAGTFAYQWFLAKGFEAITRRNYASPPYSEAVNMLADMADLTTVERVYIQSAVSLANSVVTLTPEEIALGSIQVIGAMMFYHDKGQDWEIPIPCAPRKPVIKCADNPRTNYAMLLHSYLFSLLDGSRSARVQAEMATLLYGTLTGGVVKTDISVRNLGNLVEIVRLVVYALNPAGPIGGLIYDGVCADHFQVPVGSFRPQYDSYSAMVALAGELLDANKGLNHRTFLASIRTAVQSSIGALYSPGLPSGDVGIDGALKHNPRALLGNTFSWTDDYQRRESRQIGVAYGSACGPTSSALSALATSPGGAKDVMTEHAGLDYLLPMSMVLRLYREERIGGELDEVLGSSKGFRQLQLADERRPYLPACTTDSVSAASAVSSANYVPCGIRWPAGSPLDLYDRTQRNDGWSTATALTQWNTYRLTLDRQTAQVATRSSSDARYPPVAVIRGPTGKTTEVVVEQDHDFFKFMSDKPCALRVMPKGAQGVHVYLNGEDVTGTTATVYGPYVENHIVITGPAAGEYELRLFPLWTRAAGTLQSGGGSLKIDVKRTGPGEFQGSLQYSSAATSFAATVDRVYGAIGSTVFVGRATGHTYAGKLVRATFRDRCPRDVLLELLGSDGTLSLKLAEFAVSGEGLKYDDK